MEGVKITTALQTFDLYGLTDEERKIVMGT